MKSDTILLALLILSLLFNGIQLYLSIQKSGQDDMDKIMLKHRIEVNEKKATLAKVRADSLQHQFVQRHRADSMALLTIKINNRSKEQRVKILREPVQPLIDSIQALGDFVKANDSLLAGKDEEIQQMELRHRGQIVDLRAQLRERADELMATEAQRDAWRESAVMAEGKATQERKGKKLWRGVAVGLGVLAAYLSVK
jgi:hypothetical protein